MGARSAAASVVRHVGGVAAEATLVAALVATVALALSPVYAPAKFMSGTQTTLAAKGGSTHAKSTGATITVPDGTFGSTTVASVSAGSGPWVYATCSQYGSTVYQQYLQVDSNYQATLTLGPTPMWPSGAASCAAQVGNWSSAGKWVVQGGTSFSVGG
jgi:hypothetical protein